MRVREESDNKQQPSETSETRIRYSENDQQPSETSETSDWNRMWYWNTERDGEKERWIVQRDAEIVMQ